MADEVSQVQGETPTPQAGETPAQAQTAANAEQLAAKLDELQKQLKAVNRESAERRKALEAFEKAEAERKAAEMTEAQKLQAKLDALTKERDAALAAANERAIRADVLVKAGALFEHPEDVYEKLKAGLTLADDGTVEGLDDALKALAKERPGWLKKSAGAQLKASNPGANGHQPGESDAERRARIYGAGGNIFSTDFALTKGGGVVVTTKTDK